jgi:hypothetical protein
LRLEPQLFDVSVRESAAAARSRFCARRTSDDLAMLGDLSTLAEGGIAVDHVTAR